MMHGPNMKICKVRFKNQLFSWGIRSYTKWHRITGSLAPDVSRQRANLVFETSGTIYPVTTSDILEEWILRLHRCENKKKKLAKCYG